MNNPITIFDSGIGGISILKKIRQVLPNENYIYLADSKNNPYGEKTKEELFNIVDNNVKELLKYNPKLIVVACNTATTMVLSSIREKYKETFFVGTEPALKVVHDKYPNQKTIVLATKGTEYSERFKELCNLYQTKNTEIVRVDELANLIEKDSNELDKYLKEKLTPYIGSEVVVLGCTHFPFATNNISKVLGKVIYVDGGNGIAKRVYRTLFSEKNINSGLGSITIIAEDNVKKRIDELLKEE